MTLPTLRFGLSGTLPFAVFTVFVALAADAILALPLCAGGWGGSSDEICAGSEGTAQSAAQFKSLEALLEFVLRELVQDGADAEVLDREEQALLDRRPRTGVHQAFHAANANSGRDGLSGPQPFISIARNPNWLVLRQRRAIFESGIGRLPEENICVLDVGGRLQPYRELLGTRIGRYVAVDLEFTPLVSAVASGEALPFRDEQFDLVICTQVLEYFAEPQRAARELWRVLRKDGFAFVSAPAIFLAGLSERVVVIFFGACCQFSAPGISTTSSRVTASSTMRNLKV